METKNRYTNLTRLIGLFLLFCVQGTVAQTIQTASKVVDQWKQLQAPRMSEMRPSFFNDTLLTKNLPPAANNGMPKPDEYMTRDSVLRKSAITGTEKLDSTIIENWNDTTGLWINSQKTEYTYGVNESVITNKYFWNESSSKWEDVVCNQEASAYDEHGNLILSIQPGYWSSLCRIKEECTYDSNGNKTSSIPSYWNELEKRWLFFSACLGWHRCNWICKEEWTYNDFGNCTLHIRYNWVDSTNQWTYKDKSVHTRDSLGREIFNSFYSWEDTSNQFAQKNEYDIIQDTNGTTYLSSYYNWDMENRKWIGSSKSEHIIHVNDSIELYCNYNWDLVKDKWIYSSKYENTYNKDRQLIFQTNFRWDTTQNGWMNSIKIEFVYDLKGREQLWVELRWDTIQNGWVNSRKYESNYDPNGHQILAGWYDWYLPAGYWMGTYKWEQIYNADGKVIMYCSYNWNSIKKDWAGNYKEERTYDADGKQTSYITYNWDTHNYCWIGNTRSQLTYDGNGHLTYVISYNWDNLKKAWIGAYKEENTFNANGQQTMYITYNWDIAKNIWIGSSKWQQTYDTNRILYISFNWDFLSNNWMNQEKHEYNYAVNMGLISEAYYQWDSKTRQWIGLRKSEYGYTEQGYQAWEIVYQWNLGKKIFIASTRTTWYYRELNRFAIAANSYPELCGMVTGDGIYNIGSVVNLTALPDKDYSFLNWSENGMVISYDSVYTFTVSSDRMLVANFFLRSGNFKISAYSNPVNGGIIIGDGIYYAGTPTSLTALPGVGYRFINWTENGNIICTDSIYNFTVSSDRMIVANFTEKTDVFTGKMRKISVYPNPASDELYIKGLEGMKPGSLSFVVYDVSGRIVSAFKGETDNKINIQYLSKGLYFLSIREDISQITVLRFIKD